MSTLGYLIIAIAKVLGLIINIYTIVIIIAALISWVSPDPYNPIVKILYRLTQPVFRLVRGIMPRTLLRLPIDISPIIVLIALTLIDGLIVGALYRFGAGMVR